MGNRSRIKGIFRYKGITLLFALVVVVVFYWLINNSYLTMINIRGMMNAASLAGTLAVGIGCLLISGNVNLAAGAEGMLGGVLVALLIKGGVPWPLAVILIILAGAAAGAFTAFLVNKLNFMAFIATIGLSSVYQGLGYIITGSENVAISNEAFYQLGSTLILGIPLPFIIMAALFVIYGVMLSSTRFGRKIYMCGGNRNAARLAGINPKKVTTILFMNSSAISALGGCILASRMHAGAPSGVLGYEFDAITAAVLGGIAFMGGSGGMLGCFLGLMLIAAVNNGLQAINVQAYWQITFQGLLLLLALTLDYFNERSRQKALRATDKT